METNVYSDFLSSQYLKLIHKTEVTCCLLFKLSVCVCVCVEKYIKPSKELNIS